MRAGAQDALPLRSSTPRRTQGVAVLGYGQRLPGPLWDETQLWEMLRHRGFVQELVTQRYGRAAVPYSLDPEGSEDGQATAQAFRGNTSMPSLYEGYDLVLTPL